MNYYLGVDVGTSSVKSLLMDSEGKTVGTSQIGYDIIKEKLQYAEQDMEKLWEATKETITDLVKRYPEESAKIHGISYSGQMHGLVMIGADGKLIRNAIIWADQRSEKEIQKIYDITGKDTYRGTVLNSLSTGFLISSLMWVKEHEPENFEKIRYVSSRKIISVIRCAERSARTCRMRQVVQYSIQRSVTGHGADRETSDAKTNLPGMS